MFVDVPEDSESATVIPFPRAAISRAPVEMGEMDAQLRLARAVRALDAALGEQKAAVAAWRTSLVELSASMQRLGAGVARYRDTMTTVGANVDSLRDQALLLDRRASAMAGLDQG